MTPISHVRSLVACLRSTLVSIASRRRIEREMEAELALHIQIRTADLIRTGLPPQDAARQARIELGNPLTHKEGMRSALGLRWLDELSADLRYAIRYLRKSPVFTAVAVTSLALAIGANTTIFSVAKQVLYERLAVPHAADLRLLAWTGSQDHVAVHHIWGDYYSQLPGGRVASSSFAYPAYQQLRAQNQSLQDLMAFKSTAANVTVGKVPERMGIEMVSGNYYNVLAVEPQMGRLIGPSDDVTTEEGTVAVISDGLWQRAFDRSPQVIGQVIHVGYVPLTVIGVNPRGFTGAKNVQQSPDVFVPLSLQPLLRPFNDPNSANEAGNSASGLENPTRWWVNIMGRTRPGIGDAAAQSALDTQLSAIVRATMPVRKGEDLPRLELRDGSRGLFVQKEIFAKPMAMLLTFAGLVLLLACANVANLMLARGSQRQREMSVRLALGAGRTRILRQMLVESLLLAFLGGLCGLLTAYLGRNIIPKLTQNAWERTDFHVNFDWKVFAFTAAVTLFTGILFGLVPAVAAARAEVTHGLKEVSLSVTRRRSVLGNKSLVGFQIALSTLLILGAGLFLRTLLQLHAIDPGFRTDHLLLAEINPPERRYPAGADVALHRRFEQSFAAIPGVESVTLAADPYVADDTSTTDFLPQGMKYNPQGHFEEAINIVGNAFFQTMQIPIVAGRAFGEQDTAASPKVGIINRALANKRFPGQNPVGKFFRTEDHDADGHGSTTGEDWIQIVGVCGDTRYATLRDDPPPQFFLPYVQQKQVGGMTYEIRTRLAPEQIVPALRRILQQADPDLPIVDLRTQQQQIDAALQQERLFVTLTSGFGLLALALACVGIYGVMAYSVAQRTNEIGIRLALGAQPDNVRRMILRESTVLTGIGIVVGVAGALALARLVKSMLYGVPPYDPVTLTGGIGLLFAVALASSWIPARRAASIEPMRALRHE